MIPTLLLAASLHVPVRLVNSADMPLQDLASLRGEAARLLEPAGVRLAWEGHAPLEIRLVECGDPGAPACRPGVLGSTITRLDDPGASYAVVYVDRVRQLSASAPGLRGRVLGRVLAHELVHLLAGPGAHEGRGLMSAQWDPGELAAPLPAPRIAARTGARIRARSPSARRD